MKRAKKKKALGTGKKKSSRSLGLLPLFAIGKKKSLILVVGVDEV